MNTLSRRSAVATRRDFIRTAAITAGVPDALAAGANIIGSCCGSAPEHTRAIRAAIDAFNAAP